MTNQSATKRNDMSRHAEELIRGRRAIRSFRPDPVAEETMQAVFSLAGAAPSNSNTQPWTVEVVSGPARDRLSAALLTAHTQKYLSVDFPYRDDLYTDLHRRRREDFGETVYRALGIARDDHPAREAHSTESLRFYGAPHVALILAPPMADERMAADIGMYGQTLLLAMTAYGIASCPQGLLGFYGETIRHQLGITDGKVLFGVSFGYANTSAAVNRIRVARAKLCETTRFHT
ncbi:nitroreductase [Nocardia brasiliensis]|uniref:Oxidoreductase n=1 Tax=Nocardia brasiliensis (strain ATCC 700358 / HUJEG-1) TaxID=1133849 RepID=K0ETQ2_NOCB7|nr:nitroreductase [Nocardia brasiliensis]AFU00484.1 oxidoreductase [Nocardia brasiliensis ATCC 700358]OCF83785.1 oxidoreductase [Nocardia brasiliensis]